MNIGETLDLFPCLARDRKFPSQRRIVADFFGKEVDLHWLSVPQTACLFSGRRRPDWQSKPGTEAALASRQNSNINWLRSQWTQKDVALKDYRRGNMASHQELKELMLICLQKTCYRMKSSYMVLPTILNNFQYVSFIRYSNQKSELN